MAIPLVFGAYGRGAIGAGALALAGCSGKSDATPTAPAPAAFAQPASSASSASRFPTTGFGATYRHMKVGFTISPDMEITVEGGVAAGAFGLTTPVFKFSARDGSFIFLPDPNPELSLECGPHTFKYSGADGFGRELGKKFPALKGRVVLDVKADFPQTGRLSSAQYGTLQTSGNKLTFVPAGLVPVTHPQTIQSILGGKPIGFESALVTPPHVLRSLGAWVPENGYRWADGTNEFRFTTLADMTVRWTPGEKSVSPVNLRAAATEGSWEPAAGYVWPDGLDDPLPATAAKVRTVRWEPGRPWRGKPGIVASAEEGMMTPAPGYTWVTADLNDQRVRPLGPLGGK